MAYGYGSAINQTYGYMYVTQRLYSSSGFSSEMYNTLLGADLLFADCWLMSKISTTLSFWF
jgi:hypothetical protein